LCNVHLKGISHIDVCVMLIWKEALAWMFNVRFIWKEALKHQCESLLSNEPHTKHPCVNFFSNEPHTNIHVWTSCQMNITQTLHKHPCENFLSNEPHKTSMREPSYKWTTHSFPLIMKGWISLGFSFWCGT
jgi:hypothetical protein